MDVQFKARALWKSGNDVMVMAAKKLSSGISFEELFSVYTSSVRVFIPTSVVHLVDYFFAFNLFHLYLLYVLCFAVFLSVSKKLKLKGSGIAPITGALKEKAGVLLTYFFVIQSISRWTFGMPALDKLMGWAFQVKPQINFKPQIKIGKSKSADSVISVKSKLGADIHVGFESDDETTRRTIKQLGKVRRNVDFAAEMAEAVFGQKEEEGEEDEEEQEWQDANDSSLLLAEPEVESTSLVQKWLEGSDSADPEEVKKHVMRLISENGEMRRRSFMHKSEEK